ncbi:hypothetical protein V6N11_016270 [Hibiscus sabdariffa]|uniref:Uncharacterized protein n=1 Tax=Hibiscus sabdariffa TaxID=183260 RepID=A0ABR2TUP4_9ROSI
MTEAIPLLVQIWDESSFISSQFCFAELLLEMSLFVALLEFLIGWLMSDVLVVRKHSWFQCLKANQMV